MIQHNPIIHINEGLKIDNNLETGTIHFSAISHLVHILISTAAPVNEAHYTALEMIQRILRLWQNTHSDRGQPPNSLSLSPLFCLCHTQWNSPNAVQPW
jgi:hypothetical protein